MGRSHKTNKIPNFLKYPSGCLHSTSAFWSNNRILRAHKFKTKFYSQHSCCMLYMLNYCFKTLQFHAYYFMICRKRFQELCHNDAIRPPGLIVMKDVAIAKSEFVPGEKAVTKIQDFMYDEDLFDYCRLPQVGDSCLGLVGKKELFNQFCVGNDRCKSITMLEVIAFVSSCFKCIWQKFCYFLIKFSALFSVFCYMNEIHHIKVDLIGINLLFNSVINYMKSW